MLEKNQILYSPDNMKKARKKAGFTQESAAEQLGVSVEAVRSWEQGKSEPQVSNLRAAGRLYGISFIV